jgi:sugar/nucleoside kinase (ribokinase family)
MARAAQDPALDYLVIGHVSADRADGRVQLGGTAAFAGLTARAVGRRVAVVTSAAPDLDLSPLSQLHTSVVASPQSTTFENRPTPAGRLQILHARAAPLSAEHVPLSWRSISLVHLGPIANEVDAGLIDLFSGSFVGVTAQGRLRAWDSEGRVRATGFETIRPLLQMADAVVLSREDLSGSEEAARELASLCRVLALTDGPRGATVVAQGESRDLPAPTAVEIDATGAGDIFAAVFFHVLQHTSDPWQAGRSANSLASRSVSRRGLASVPSPEEARQFLLPVAS